MNKSIFYICNYDDYLNNRSLITAPSAVSKSDYIIQALLEANFNVNVFSVAPTNSKNFFLKSILRKVNSHFQIFYILNFKRSNVFLKFLSVLAIYFQVLFFLLKRKSDDIILVYHSKRLTRLIYFITKIKRLRVFYEIEEIYSAVSMSSSREINKEIKTLSRSKGNIVVNDILKEKLDNTVINTPCYGIYKHNAVIKKIDWRSTINVVYAGVIRDCHSDAFVAVQTAKYLPCNYCIHILGYGTENNISLLKKEIENLPHKSCTVIYHGCLYGDEYSAFLSKCHIGLCTRILLNKYSDYTFPSKIFAYLSNNVIPICSNIDCVKKSRIADEIYFVQKVTPECVAKTIMSIDVDFIDYKSKLAVLNDDFVNEVKKLFC